MRLLLIAALCLPVSAAHGQAWKHWEAYEAIPHADPQKTGRPPMMTPAERNAVREQCAVIAERELDGDHAGNERAKQIADLIRASKEPEAPWDLQTR